MPYYTYPIIYLTIILFGILNYQKYKSNSYLKLFLFFLIYSFLTEVMGVYFGSFLKIRAYFIYNSWIILSTLFYFVFFLNKVENFKNRNFIKSLIALYMLFLLINISFFTSFSSQWLVSVNIFGKILISISILISFAELLKKDGIVHIKETLFFWISIGVLLYNIGFVPVYVIGELIDYQGLFRYITFGLNIIMSICFITGFIVSKKEFNK